MSDKPRRAVDLKRLLSLARPEARPLVIGTLALAIGSVMTLLYPMVIQQLIDGIEAGGGKELVTRGALMLVGLFSAGAFFGAIRAWLFTVSGERIVASLRTQLYRSIISQEIAFFDERRTGELTNRLASDTTVLQNTVTVNVSMLLRFTIMAIGAIGFLFYTSWKLTLLTLTVVPVVAISGGFFGRKMRAISRNFQDALAESTVVAEETIAGVRTVRAFAREEQEIARYSEAVEASFAIAKRRASIIAMLRGFIGFGGYGAIAVVLWFGGNMLVDGTISIGELTSFLLYTLTVAFSLGALSGLYEDFMKALGASERVFELMDRKATVTGGAHRLAEIRGEVVLAELDFAYPTRPDMPVLQKLNLTLSPGEVVALVGHSGSGKSTVAALLSRFYDPQGGSIHIDGTRYNELDIDWLREQVGVVSQEPILFATSILDNIRYGRPAASLDEVTAAAKAANAHDFIGSFPEGYETLVGERGVKLSGGQKQRVAIARALLKDPRLLILDEATSALDAESEHLVQEALDRLMQGRTTLIIAHRLSTVKEADRVCVLDQGCLAQQGTHDELVAQDGIYRRLVQHQFSAA
ncbi:MAG: ABC transporter transmembrane domain-containing protein [Myxococcota bacterium]|nr:ABC transporter transmembrane domain-containing protein [Myxococcota bacterium]